MDYDLNELLLEWFAEKLAPNLMNEPLSAAGLPEPLWPQPLRPSPPARRVQPYREVWPLFDPAPVSRKRTFSPSDIRDLLDERRENGTEKVRGRRFVRWRTIRGLGVNNTSTIMANVRAEVNTAFYLRHVYSYHLRNIENGDVILHYKNNARQPGWVSKTSTGQTRNERLKTSSTVM